MSAKVKAEDKIDQELGRINDMMRYKGPDGKFMIHEWMQEMVLPLRDRYIGFLFALRAELDKTFQD